jgi:hypothetical protein
VQRLIEGDNLPRNNETRHEEAKHDHHRFSDRHTLPLLLAASLSMPPATSLYPCAHTLKQSGQRRIELWIVALFEKATDNFSTRS